jgi:hypothetical protein
MAANTQELLEFCLIKFANISKGKAKTISTRFEDLHAFVETPPESYQDFTYVGGNRAIICSAEEIERIKRIQSPNYLNPKLTPSENFIKILGMNFLSTQVTMIHSLRLDDLIVSPLLIASLKLSTADQILKYNVYQTVSRSIVTSMGFVVQDLLRYSGPDIYDAKDYPEVHGTKWDLVKRKVGDVVSWIEVKSGPNDIDKTQILHYKEKIEEIEKRGEKGYIGETYGKRTMNTITHHHYRTSLPDWEKRTLIGRELWDFISDDPDYHKKLMLLLKEAAENILLTRNIMEEIDDCYDRALVEFNKKYQKSKDPVKDYLEDMW